jgi:hypothetical protein
MTRELQILLDVFYPKPDPLISAEERDRHDHLDLLKFSHPELKQEEARVRFRLLFEDRPDTWFLQRLEAIREAMNPTHGK